MEIFILLFKVFTSAIVMFQPWSKCRCRKS